MEWENKIKMVQLGNKMNNGEDNTESKKEFYDYVLSQIPNFDEQAWDMFCHIAQIVPSEMKEDISIWEKIYPYIKKIEASVDTFGFRTGMRIAMIQTFCEEQLNTDSEKKLN